MATPLEDLAVVLVFARRCTSCAIAASKIVVVLAVLLTPVVCRSAETPTVHVGDGSVSGATLRPYDNAWRLYLRKADGSHDDRGMCTDHVRLQQIDGAMRLIRQEGTTTFKLTDTGATSRLSMTFDVADAQTLAAISDEDVRADGTHVSRRFDQRSAEVSAGADQPTSFVLTEPVFDFNGGMAGLLLAALPLHVGYRAALPALGENGFETAEIRVTREEVTAAGRLGKLKTFVVDVGSAPVQATYWISKSPPYVIRAEVETPNGTAVWEML